MIPYYIFFMFFGIAASLENLRQDDYNLQLLKKGIFASGFFFILFFVGFRYKLGSDWLSYLRMYEESISFFELFSGDNLAFSSDFTEPGFKVLVTLCKELGINYAFFVFLITAFNTISIFYFLHKNKIRKKLVFLALILILTVFYEFDILRQSIALHIILFAYVGEKRVKLYRLLPIVLLAMTFHYTAVIFLVFHYFQKLNISRNGVFFLSAVYCLSLFISLPIVTSFMKFLEPFVGGTIASILSKAVTLIEAFGFQRTVSPTTLLNLAFLIILAVRIKKIKLSQAEQLLIKFFLFYIVINILFKEIQEVADRFSYYFNVGIAFMFCLLSDFIRVKEKQMILLLVPLLFIMMRLMLHFRDPGIVYGQTPYRNYFFIENSDEPEILKRYDMMQSIKSVEVNEKKN